MDTDRLTQRLMATFLGELEDHLRALERDLLALEKEPAAAAGLFKTLFRTAHSLKGAARSVGVEAIEMAGHRLEDLFASGREGRLPVDAAYFDLVLPAVDDIREAGCRLHARSGNGAVAGEARLEERAPSVVPAMPNSTAAPSISSPTPLPAQPDAGAWSGVVRVAAEKLDALLAQSGELLVVRHRSLARVEAAGALHDASSGWRREWRRIEQRVAELLRASAEAA